MTEQELRIIYSMPLPGAGEGEVFTLATWREYLNSGFLYQFDGTGYYATEYGYNRKSNVWVTDPPMGATHVVWFNHKE